MVINQEKSTVLIIGAGIGGIATAARLAQKGYRVKVFEKNEIPGGRCGQMTIQDYRFDTGATLFLMPELYAETFTALDERMEDHLDLQRIDPTYHLFFQDNSKLELTSDLHKLMMQIEAIEFGSYERLLHYLGEGKRHYRLSLPNLICRDFRHLTEFINPKMILMFFQLDAFSRHDRYAKHYFKTPKLQMAFTFQDLYMGLSPYESPATYSLLQHTELSDGLYYPKGGMYRIVQSLTSVAEKLGVEFVYNTSVSRILVQDRHAIGLELSDGKTVPGDIVVANADLGYVYRDLLPEDGTATRIDRKEYGCSTVMFYWGLDKQYPKLGPHNLFFCGDYKKGFDDIFKYKTMSEQPNFYIHVPSRLDPSAAPAGCDSLSIAIPVGHIDEKIGQDWSEIQKHARAFIIQRLDRAGIIDLGEHIKVEIDFCPKDWQKRYNLTRGSAHGLSHKLKQMGYFRPHNRHKTYHNLYFVGASTHPGTGVPTVLVSASLTAQRILDDTYRER
jgi:phytoene desaturase